MPSEPAGGYVLSPFSDTFSAKPGNEGTEVVFGFANTGLRRISADDTVSALSNPALIGPYRIHYDPAGDRWITNFANGGANSFWQTTRAGVSTGIKNVSARRVGSCWSMALNAVLFTVNPDRIYLLDETLVTETLQYSEPDEEYIYCMWEDWHTSLLYYGTASGKVYEIDPTTWTGRRLIVDTGSTNRGIFGDHGSDTIYVCGAAGIIREYDKATGGLVSTPFTNGEHIGGVGLVWDGVVGPGGFIYFTDLTGSVYKIDAEGIPSVLASSNGFDDGPTEGIASDRFPAPPD